MNYTGKDVDIFVFTYNRAHLITQTIDNLLLQTEPGIKIHVIDNASTDRTPDVVKHFESQGVLYFRGDVNSGWYGNYERAKLLANRSWTMLFHDDDLLHPSYCEWALRQVNANKHIDLLISTLSFEAQPDNLWPTWTNGKPVLCKNVNEFAAILYSGLPVSFASAIYRTEQLLSFKWFDVEYGKIVDRPFLMKFLENQGQAIVFKNPLVKYRLHFNQDSHNPETGPYVSQLSSLHTLYLKYLGCNPFSFRGRVFLTNNYKFLRDEYKRLALVDQMKFGSFEDYWKYIYELKGATIASRYVGMTIKLLNPKGIVQMLVFSKRKIKEIIPKFLIKKILEIYGTRTQPKKIIEHMEVDFALSRVYDQRKIKVLDIGSHHGEFIDIIGSFNHFHEWEIYCVEPLDQNRKKIENKKRKYKNVSVNILPVGISEISEIKKFYLGDADTLFTCNESWRDEFKENFKKFTEHVINCLSVDDLVRTYSLPKSDFDFIKIDVEGHDLNVIKSFCHSQINSRVVMFEVSKDVHSVQDAVDLLRKKGFHEFVLFGRVGIPTTFLGEYENVTQLETLFSSGRISCGNIVCFRN